MAHNVAVTAVNTDAGPAARPPGPASFAQWPTLIPRWWLVIAWVAMGVAALWPAQARWGLDRTGVRVLAGVVWVVAAIAVHVAMNSALVRGHWSQTVRAWNVVLAMVAGLLSVLITPSGLGEVPVYVAAVQIPFVFQQRTARWVTVGGTVAASLTVGYASHSVAGLMAGIGVPFLAQRSVDRKALIEQRDRAEAMVVEVEAGRQAEAQAAALRERAHIAREMHDVLAHSLAGLSLQLQAARALAHQAQRPGGDTRLLDAIDHAADLARDGLEEARTAVGTLQTPALHGVDDLAELLRSHPGDIDLTVTGAPGALAPEAGHAVYRAVQESLTNAARYAPGSPVQVCLDWSVARLTVRVIDRGVAPGHTPLVGQGTGLGLAGMRERLRAVGGSVQAGPSGAGWQVAVSVPTQEAA